MSEYRKTFKEASDAALSASDSLGQELEKLGSLLSSSEEFDLGCDDEYKEYVVFLKLRNDDSEPEQYDCWAKSADLAKADMESALGFEYEVVFCCLKQQISSLPDRSLS